MRHTRGHTANRRSHHALKPARFVECKDCHAMHLMHRVCNNCGKYRGRLVIDTMKKALKKTKEVAVKEKAKPEAKEKKTEKPKEAKKTKEPKAPKEKK